MKKNKFLSLAFVIGALVLCCVLFAACGGRKLASFSVESAGTNYTLVDDTVTVVYGEDYSRLPEQLSVTAAFDDGTALCYTATELADNGFSLESNIPEGEKTPAGSYTVVIRSEDLNESKTITLVVKKATATLNAEQLSWSENAFTYDGAEKRVEITNLPSEFSVTYENNTATNAGEYTATATIHVIDSQNYSFEALVLSCPFEIILGENRVTLMVDGEEYETVLVRYGDAISVAEPTKRLYDFAGWYTAETDGERITAVTSGMTLFAQWTLKEEYKPFEFTADDDNNVTITGVRADYRSATSLRIPDAVTAIAEDALKDLTALTSLTIGSGVTSIGKGAFAGCTALTEINYNAIACADLAVVDYSNQKGYFDLAGSEAGGITLKIGENVTKIPAYLFCVYKANNVPKITRIVFAEGLTGASIGAHAFENVKSLTSVTISGVSTIGECAFANCGSLAEVTIGSGVTKIEKEAFRFAYKLARIYFNATEAEDLAERAAIFRNAGQTSGAITLTIGANVKKIPANLFSTELNSTSNELPRIKTVIFEEGSVCTSIGESAFAYLNKLESVTLPNTEMEIGKFAFYNCTALTGVTLPAKLKSLGTSAFNGTALTSITLPAGLTSVGLNAFSKCAALTEINYNIKTYDDLTAYNGFFENAGTGGITLRIGANVEKIPAYFFRSASIKEVIFEGSSACTGIGAYAFCSCTQLGGITLPERLESIGEYAFKDCTALTSITLPAGLTSVGSSAFSKCTALTEINYNIKTYVDLTADKSFFEDAGGSGGITLRIGANVERIPAYFFCKAKITSVVFAEDSVCTGIGERAFSQCTVLTAITLPTNITSIGVSAFRGCSALVSVNIPENVTSIGDSAFRECKKLAVIYYNAKKCNDITPSDNEYPFYSAGQEGDGITVTIGKGVERIPAHLFHNPYSETKCSPKIIAVVFAESSACTSIGENAFRNCVTLKWITLPASITTIESGAFYGCNALEAAYYAGTATNSMTVENLNEKLSSALYYYSAETPTGSGKYWHLVDGVPTAWTTA